uniref:Lon N-terminal domain-containing protein n=1 Tax=Leptocylindrus danicus TaxID=163516 RepID=A0A7S2JYJ2_9STRA|mmetsp:Transcript_14374/g.21285  ORF Transcript_14374/g.21285 Transcript_14374/m.21285 type:complete len:367 (+) Transcript_14374:37-1137(+)
MSLQHSYLPGVTRVIVGGCNNLNSGCHSMIRVDGSNLDCIPVLKLHGVVLYPGFSLPLRLHDPRWTSYLREKVDEVRFVRSSNMNVVLGILPADPEEESESSSSNANNSSGKKDIGRIGTVAVIESTNILVDEGDTSENQRSTRMNNDEVILTVLGLCRFRIISCAISHPSEIVDLPLYRLGLLQGDADPPNPPFRVNMRGTIQTHSMDAFLHSVSPIPRHCWKYVWPHHLVKKIRSIIVDGGPMSEWDGLRKSSSFPCSKNDSGYFSFWLATHMPLSLGEKVAILEMETVTERLRYILSFMRLKSHRGICCRSCDSRLASVVDLFSLVGITEGTSGAYGESSMLAITMFTWCQIFSLRAPPNKSC